MDKPESNGTREYYDDFSGWYERERGQGYHAVIDEIESGIVNELSWGRDVLEVGCGTGLVLEKVVPQARSAMGADLSPGMVKQAGRRGLAVVASDATALPFRDQSFDVVYSFKVLAHVAAITEALREIGRVTRPGGRLILEFYNPRSLRYLAKMAGGPGRISETRRESEVYTRWDTQAQVEAILPRGIELLEWRGARILTPAAFVHRLPVIGPLLGAAEKWAASTPLARFAGFSIAVCRKR